MPGSTAHRNVVKKLEGESEVGNGAAAAAAGRLCCWLQCRPLGACAAEAEGQELKDDVVDCARVGSLY